MATFYTLQQKSFHVNKEEGYAWCTLFFVEAAIVIALNMFAIIIFSTDRRVRKHSTYLLINLSAADVGVGALVIPASVLLRGNTYDLWNVKINPIGLISAYGVNLLFCGSSLGFLASISVERLHATRNPIGHRSMSGLFYKIWGASIWVASLIFTLFTIFFMYYDLLGTKIWFFAASGVFCLLLILCCSYCGIFATIRCGEQPRHEHRGQARKERKLTITLFIVTLVSLCVWTPYVFFTFLEEQMTRILSDEALLRLRCICELLFFANSFVNPILYTIRIPEFRRAGIKLITCIKDSPSRQQSQSTWRFQLDDCEKNELALDKCIMQQ